MDYLVFSGNSNKSLAQSIVAKLGLRLGDADVRKFSDGEIFVRINESVRGRDVFLIQSTCAPAEEHLIEMMIMVDALKRASANSITAIMPYFAMPDRTEQVSPEFRSRLSLWQTSSRSQVLTGW